MTLSPHPRYLIGMQRPSTALGRVIRFASILAVASGAAHAQSGTPPTTPSPERGRTLFVKQMCYTCHGYAGQGGERGSGPRLVPNLFPYPAFVQQVRHPRQDMPRYSSRFTSDADLADMHAYLASIKPGPKAADIPALRE
jgi:mono/diheme cytochrome c family protein